jgi:hypothetical protein
MMVSAGNNLQESLQSGQSHSMITVQLFVAR